MTIVGGSLGGLFTGIVLVRLGYDVTIFESTPAEILEDQGAGISDSSIIPSFHQDPPFSIFFWQNMTWGHFP